jgi:hypothetical protein
VFLLTTTFFVFSSRVARVLYRCSAEATFRFVSLSRNRRGEREKSSLVRRLRRKHFQNQARLCRVSVASAPVRSLTFFIERRKKKPHSSSLLT